MIKKILVTGAGGYIASITSYLLLQKGFEVVAIDNLTTGYYRPLALLQEKFGEGKFRFYTRNLLDNLDDIFEKEQGIDAVLHFAASCMVDESVKFPEKYFTNNTAGSQHLFETLIKYKIKNIIFSSTCAVYDTAQYIPVDEKHPINPVSPYGASKRLTETMLEWYGKLDKLQFVILRYFNVCGASDDGLLGDSKKPSSLLVQNVVRSVLGIEPFKLTCQQVDTPDKTPIRDYINVVDLAEAHISAMEYLDSGKGKNEIINLGTGTGSSVLEIVKAVEEITGTKIPREKGETRQGEMPKVIASTTKAQELLGWKASRSIKDSVTSLIIWYKAHPHGWDK